MTSWEVALVKEVYTEKNGKGDFAFWKSSSKVFSQNMSPPWSKQIESTLRKYDESSEAGGLKLEVMENETINRNTFISGKLAV